jgi:hypothetical protein
MNGRPFWGVRQPTNGSTAGWPNCFKALMEGITLMNWMNSMSIKIKPNAGN